MPRTPDETIALDRGAGSAPYRVAPPFAASGSFRNERRDRLRPGGRGRLASAAGHRRTRTLDRLIRDCEELGRDNHLARAIADGYADCIVGDEVHVEARSKDRAWNADVQRRWRDWAGDPQACDATGLQTLAEIGADIACSWLFSGGKVVHRLRRGDDPMQLAVYEVARLRNPSGKPDEVGPLGGYWAGVEVDASGRPAAYHLARWNRWGTGLEVDTERVDAGEAWLVNDPHLQQAGRYRAEPRLASVVDRLEVLDRAVESVFGSFEIALYFAMVIKRNQPSESLADIQAREMVASGEAENEEEARDRGVWQPAGILELEPGEDVSYADPKQPQQQFLELFWAELQTIANAAGTPLEIAFFRNLKNYSASRSTLAVAWRKFGRHQRSLIAHFIRPVYLAWLAGEILAGRIRHRDDWDACEFYLPTMPALELEKEVSAHADAIAAGLELRETGLRALGWRGDVEQFYEERGAELSRERELGIATARRLAVVEGRSTQLKPGEAQPGTEPDADADGERDDAEDGEDGEDNA